MSIHEQAEYIIKIRNETFQSHLLKEAVTCSVPLIGARPASISLINEGTCHRTSCTQFTTNADASY